MTSEALAGWRSDEIAAEELLRALRRRRDTLIPAKVWATPGELAAAVERDTRQTPALDLIDRELIRAFETPDSRLILSMPPQEGKSQRVSRTFPLWMLTRNPEMRIVLASYAEGLSTTFSADIRQWIATNNGIEGTLDLRLRLSRSSKSAARWQLADHKGGVYAVGVGGGLTGRPADAMIVDDPFADAEQANSPAYRTKVWEWWQKVALTRLAPGAPLIVVMTRWHEDDLAGRILAAEDASIWRTVNIPALADHDPRKGEADPLGREPGVWLQSARGDRDWEAIRIRSGSSTFSALYQGHPTPDDGKVWLKSWWGRYPTRFWTPTGHTTTVTVGGVAREVEALHLEGLDEMFTSWDLAFKDTKGSDFVVGQVWGRRRADAYLLDQVRGQWSFTDTVDELQAIRAKWPQVKVHLVEDKANGPAVISLLKKDVPGLIAVNPGTDSKYGRASAVSPFIEAGNAHLPADTIRLFSVDDYLAEVSAFPNASHDDQVDATSQALARFFLNGAGAAAWIASMRAEVAKRQAQVPQELRDALEAADSPTDPDTAEPPMDPRQAARQIGFLTNPSR